MEKKNSSKLQELEVTNGVWLKGKSEKLFWVQDYLEFKIAKFELSGSNYCNYITKAL